jgi:hypothetical protein
MSKYAKRTLGQLSQTEKNWIEGLKRSSLDLTKPFNAKAAMRAIIATPTTKGCVRKLNPGPYKMAYVLRKAQGFSVDHYDTKKRPMFVYDEHFR